MDLSECFRLPPESKIGAFADAQVHLYRNDVSLQDYFLPLQLEFGRPDVGVNGANCFKSMALGKASRITYRRVRAFSRRKHKVDVLFCPMPYFGRPAENNLTARMLLGLVKTGATILCLMPNNAPCCGEIEQKLRETGRLSQVTFVDPINDQNLLASRLFSRASRERARSAFCAISDILNPFGLTPPGTALFAFERIAQFVEAWEGMEQNLEFDAVVARCHWQVLCSPVCRTASERGKSVITFQQGVIDHTLDAPVEASHYVAFGRSSAAFLAKLNRLFFRTVGRSEPKVDFINGGSLFDQLLNLPNQFEKRTLLVICDADPNGFYGVDMERSGVWHVVNEILQTKAALRVIIRPHPDSDAQNLEAWKQIVRENWDVCELSYRLWSLEEDLSRASVVVGGWSGVLTVASASGLPAIFLEFEGFATGDLACFRTQTLSRAEAVREIGLALSSPRDYEQARSMAYKNAREYYANGANLELNADFFQKILPSTQKKPMTTARA